MRKYNKVLVMSQLQAELQKQKVIQNIQKPKKYHNLILLIKHQS